MIYFLKQRNLMLSRLTHRFATAKSSNFFWTDVNKNVHDAQYAVRGLVPTTAQEMQQEIASNPNKYPFDEITFCNIGNPQAFHQKPITFNRQVLACTLNPELMRLEGVNKDAAKRAETYLNEIVSAGSYTMSTGIQLVRKSIARFLAQDDGIEEPSLQHLFTTEGASQGVHMILSSLITCADDSIMIPIPQYPLYSAAITLYGGHASPYYLNEERGWQLDFEELERSINESRKAGKNVKAIVVINPGNPTGAIFNAETIKKIIEFGVKNKLVVIADEVYRQNIYKQGAQFFSFRNVLNKMPSQYKDQCELASLHSVSKGLLGECGLRGGYMYLHNFNPDIMQQIIKLKSINLCSNAIGQLMVELMVNPPLQGASSQTTNLYLQERDVLFNSLKQRAQLVTSALRSMKNITCNEVEGAMYAFPQIKFSQKAVEAAGKQAPDLFYCLEVLKNTGIALVPGSGFRQQAGTHHFRITTLILPQEKLKRKLEDFKKFNEEFHNKYA